MKGFSYRANLWTNELEMTECRDALLRVRYGGWQEYRPYRIMPTLKVFIHLSMGLGLKSVNLNLRNT